MDAIGQLRSIMRRDLTTVSFSCQYIANIFDPSFKSRAFSRTKRTVEYVLINRLLTSQNNYEYTVCIVQYVHRHCTMHKTTWWNSTSFFYSCHMKCEKLHEATNYFRKVRWSIRNGWWDSTAAWCNSFRCKVTVAGRKCTTKMLLRKHPRMPYNCTLR